jgi:hypothetical protein
MEVAQDEGDHHVAVIDGLEGTSAVIIGDIIFIADSGDKNTNQEYAQALIDAMRRK